MKNVTNDEKKRLRSQFLKVRRGLLPAERLVWDEAIGETVLERLAALGAETVFCYISHPDEVDTHRVIHRFLQSGGRVICPSPDIRALPEQGFYEVARVAGAALGAAPELRALPDEEPVPPVQAVIVPGIVWDRAGYRVGFGGGYFDRLLEMLGRGVVRIGLGYELQIVKAVPREAWDEPVDWLVSERGAAVAVRPGG